MLSALHRAGDIFHTTWRTVVCAITGSISDTALENYKYEPSTDASPSISKMSTVKEKEEKDIRPADVSVGPAEEAAVEPQGQKGLEINTTGMAVVGQNHTIPIGLGSPKTTTRLEYWTYCLYGACLGFDADGLTSRLGWHWSRDRQLWIGTAAESGPASIP